MMMGFTHLSEIFKFNMSDHRLIPNAKQQPVKNNSHFKSGDYQTEPMTTAVKAINNGSACSVLFLSMTWLFPASRKVLEHKTQSSALMFF